MTRSMLAPLCAAALAAALGSANLHASRLEKAETAGFRDAHGNVCAGCRIHVESTRGGPLRLDRGPPAEVSQVPPNVCSDPGASLWFPEEGEHLAAFLNSQSDDHK
jgi:hypothetical protein